jgi:hypothetical protein
MKIDPPILIEMQSGSGEIIEMADDGSEVTIRLHDGTLVKMDGQAPAALWEHPLQ